MSLDLEALAPPQMFPIPSCDINNPSCLPGAPPPGFQPPSLPQVPTLPPILPTQPPPVATPSPPAAAPTPPGPTPENPGSPGCIYDTSSGITICPPGGVGPEGGTTVTPQTPGISQITSVFAGAKGFFDFIGHPQNIFWALAALVILAVGTFVLFQPEIKQAAETVTKVAGKVL
jgi:hypothetical protein